MVIATIGIIGDFNGDNPTQVVRTDVNPPK
jgi:hypothetical protein